MTFNIEYNKKFKYFDDPQLSEITYPRSIKDSHIQDFLKEHVDKTVVLPVYEIYDGADEQNLINLLYEKYKNIKLQIFPSVKIEDFYPNIPFYYAETATNWEKFQELLSYNPTDIAIGGELGFSIDKVAKIAHSRNIKVRCMPNLAFSTWNDCPDLQKFFIRPNDIDFYGDYIDIFKLCTNDDNVNVIYEYYAQERTWFGDLREIIGGLNERLDNRSILKTFAKRRAFCDRACFKGQNCSICTQIRDLSNKLADNDLLIKD